MASGGYIDMFYVYILKGINNDRYYVGQTGNLEKRLADHNIGLCSSTKKWIPWKIVYEEEFLYRGEALKRERKIKSYKRGNAFKKLINK